MSLFVMGDFTLHSGIESVWKADCDALTDEDLATLAYLAAPRLPAYRSVRGVPKGGLRFAEALQPYATEITGWNQMQTILIVDDVLTTGDSMEEARKGIDYAVGLVIFARGPCPPWVRAIWTLGEGFR